MIVLVVVGAVVGAVLLGLTIAVMVRIMRLLEGVERGVWAIADELDGGVGLRWPLVKGRRQVRVPPDLDAELG